MLVDGPPLAPGGGAPAPGAIVPAVPRVVPVDAGPAALPVLMVPPADGPAPGLPVVPVWAKAVPPNGRIRHVARASVLNDIGCLLRCLRTGNTVAGRLFNFEASGRRSRPSGRPRPGTHHPVRSRKAGPRGCGHAAAVARAGRFSLCLPGRRTGRRAPQPVKDRMPAAPTPRDILETLVAFDTTSALTNLPLVDWVQDFAEGRGAAVERVVDDAGEKAALWITLGPAHRPGYVLSGHSDVVPVAGQAWSHDPFRLTEIDGRLYGRGTSDMKGFLAVCLALLPEMAAAPLARPLHLALSYDEEIGCLGVRPLIARMRAMGLAPLGCFVGEPTGMEVVTGHKGKSAARVTFRGKACHSALAPSGVNAVEYAARFIVHVKAISRRNSCLRRARSALRRAPHHRPQQRGPGRHRAQHRARPLQRRFRVPRHRRRGCGRAGRPRPSPSRPRFSRSRWRTRMRLAASM